MNKRLLMLIPTLHLVGGAQDQLKLLTRYLKSLNVALDVEFFYLPLEEDPISRGFSLKVKFFHNLITKIRMILRVVRFARNYHIIHLHGLGLAYYVIGFLGIFLNLKFIVKIPRSGVGSYIDLVKRDLFRKILFKLSSKGVYKFIALTQDSKISLLDLGFPPHKIEKIPNGVELPKEKIKRISDGVLKICFVGRLIPRKQVHLILTSASIIKKEGLIDFHVYIIGDGPEKQNLVETTQILGLEKHISFIGEISNKQVLEHLNKMDALVLPSLSEGMSNSLLQGCASGCIPLVFDIPQNLNIVEHAKNGFIFSSAQELAKYLTQIADFEIAEKISESAFQNVSSNYDIRKIALEYKSLYEE